MHFGKKFLAAIFSVMKYSNCFRIAGRSIASRFHKEPINEPADSTRNQLMRHLNKHMGGYLQITDTAKKQISQHLKSHLQEADKQNKEIIKDYQK